MRADAVAAQKLRRTKADGDKEETLLGQAGAPCDECEEVVWQRGDEVESELDLSVEAAATNGTKRCNGRLC